MEIKEITGKWYEKRSKMLREEYCGNITKSRPTVDREDYDVYCYKKALKITISNIEFKKLSAGSSQIRLDKIRDEIQLKTIGITNNFHKYILKTSSRAVFLSDDMIDYYTLYYSDIEKDILLFCIDDKEVINDLNSKEKEIEKRNQKRVDTINIVNNFILPYLTPVFEKYGLETICWDTENKKLSTACVRFKDPKAIHDFVFNALKEKLESECKELGIKLSPLPIKEKGITTYTNLFDLYSSEIILDKTE